MKLYEIYINNGLEYEDNEEYTFLVVCKNQLEADIIAAWEFNEHFYKFTNGYGKPSFSAKEINEIDGYEIILRKKVKMG
jgi:hypothetical protein